MKRAVFLATALLMLAPLAPAGAVDVLTSASAAPAVVTPAVKPQPAPAPSEPLPWLPVLIAAGLGGVTLIGAASRPRPEPRIRFTATDRA